MVMKATLFDTLTIRQLVDGYCDRGDNGVVAFGGRLNVRPPFQREFVYSPADRDRVMKSVYDNLPLNVMYWARNPDGTYEIIDGQQRTISICQFVKNDDGYGNPIAINFDGRRTQTFDNLSPEKQNEILDNYKLQVYVCDGNEDEKLEWFHTINIAGKVMEEQSIEFRYDTQLREHIVGNTALVAQEHHAPHDRHGHAHGHGRGIDDQSQNGAGHPGQLAQGPGQEKRQQVSHRSHDHRKENGVGQNILQENGVLGQQVDIVG